MADAQDPPPILVEGLIVHRTPSARSLRFFDVEARDQWLSDWDNAFLLVGVMALPMVGAKLLLDSEDQLPVILGSLALGLTVMAGLSLRTWVRIRGRFERIDWKTSVALDMRPIRGRPTVEATIAGGVCWLIAAAIGGFGNWVEWYWRDPGTWAGAMFGLLLFVGCGLALLQMAHNRMRYRRLRAELLNESDAQHLGAAD